MEEKFRSEWNFLSVILISLTLGTPSDDVRVACPHIEHDRYGSTWHTTLRHEHQ